MVASSIYINEFSIASGTVIYNNTRNMNICTHLHLTIYERVFKIKL